MSAAKSADPAARPTIFIVSDIRLVRDGLAQQLKRDGRLLLLGSGAPSAETLEKLSATPAHSIALDLSAADGLAFAEQIHKTQPASKVVGFAIGEFDSQVAEWARSGVCGYVEREGSVEEIVVTVLHALKGELYCSPRFAAHLLTALAARPTATAKKQLAVMESLSPREVQILHEIRLGASNKEIARQLGISPATVKNHVHHLLEKLDVRRRAQASAILSDIVTPA